MLDLEGAVKATRAWACYDCGKCAGSCPVARSGGDLSPRRHVLSAVEGRKQTVLEDASVFSCLTCGMCDRRCPVEVDFTGLVRALRGLHRSEGSEPQCPHGGALQSVMRMMARGGTVQRRTGWLEGGMKAEPEKGGVFYWAGCTPYYDAFFSDLGPSVLNGCRAAVRIMNRAGEIPVVSPEERCCGHDLLWNGDADNFELLARHNVELVERSGAETVVTSCAECLRTWKLDYEPFFAGKPPRVLHISEYIAERLPRLELKKGRPLRVAFQDPCRLGRHLGIYEPPRQVLGAVPGVDVAEMDKNRANALCCAGGTWSNCDRVAKKIQVERLKEARAAGAVMLATGCPKCRIHLRCAMKDPNLGGEMEIEMVDLAELVAAALA